LDELLRQTIYGFKRLSIKSHNMDTFEDRNTKHSAQENEEDLQKQTNAGDKKESGESQPHNELIGLTGGQPKDDDSGLDVSDYTGPHSKAGAVFDDAERPAETEAKLNNNQAPDSSEWENPEPKDDSGV
jgi:hypothetical protein